MSAPIVLFRTIFIAYIALSPLLFGCEMIRSAMYEKQDDGILERYDRLSNCDQIDYVERYLSHGRVYSPILEGTLPSNGIMLSMLMDLSEKTGITLDIAISCWTGFYYGSDESWLALCDLWRSVLGCGGKKVDRMVLLRDLDPYLAQAFDSVISSLLIDSNARFALSGLWEPQAELIARNMIKNHCDNHPSGQSIWCSLKLDPIQRFSPFLGDGRRNYWGLLPSSSNPTHMIYMTDIDSSTYVAKVVSVYPTILSFNLTTLTTGAGVEFIIKRFPDGTVITLSSKRDEPSHQ
jgi:hypothetical protein